MITTFIAFITDCILGDPQTKYHPVALLGRFIGAADKFFYKPGKSPAYYLIAGAGIAVAVTALTFALMRSMVMLLHMTLPLYGVYIVKGVILAFLICPRSLAAAALAVRREIVNGNLAEARKKVGISSAEIRKIWTFPKFAGPSWKQWRKIRRTASFRPFFFMPSAACPWRPSIRPSIHLTR